MNRISFLTRGYAFKGLLAVNVGSQPIFDTFKVWAENQVVNF